VVLSRSEIERLETEAARLARRCFVMEMVCANYLEKYKDRKG
jgi:hypothetical protein